MRQSNVILSMADQLRFDALGCYGNNQIHTPNADRLALNGSIFDNHFVQNPIRSPSRCTMLTGRYPKNHGARDNGIPLRDEEITLPEVLRSNGYVMAAIGKMYVITQFLPKEDEQEDWPKGNYGLTVIHTTCDMKAGEYLAWLKEKNPTDYEEVKIQGERRMKEDTASTVDEDINGPPQVYENHINPEFHQPAWIADRTIDLIRESEPGKPFFASCSFVDPHHPFDPPAPYDTMHSPEMLGEPIRQEGELRDKPPHFAKARCGHGYNNEEYDYRRLTDGDWGRVRAVYCGIISLVDENVGRILGVIAEKRMEEDTLIMFTNDYRELLEDHGLLFKEPFHYDSTIKTPIIMEWPGVIPKGSHYSQMMEHVGIASTLLEYAGVRSPYGVQGSSMVPVLRGDKGAGKSYAMTEFNCYDRGLSVKTLTGRDHKLTYYADQDYGELCGRNRDPERFVNLWDKDDYREVRELVLKKLMNRIMETKGTLPLRIRKHWV